MHCQTVSLSCQLTPTIACKTFHHPLSSPAQFTKSDEFLPYTRYYAVIYKMRAHERFFHRGKSWRDRERVDRPFVDRSSGESNEFLSSLSPVSRGGGRRGGGVVSRDAAFFIIVESLAAIHQGRCIFFTWRNRFAKDGRENVSSRFKTEPRPNDSSPIHSARRYFYFLIGLLKLINSLGSVDATRRNQITGGKE